MQILKDDYVCADTTAHCIYYSRNQTRRSCNQNCGVKLNHNITCERAYEFINGDHCNINYAKTHSCEEVGHFTCACRIGFINIFLKINSDYPRRKICVINDMMFPNIMFHRHTYEVGEIMNKNHECPENHIIREGVIKCMSNDMIIFKMFNETKIIKSEDLYERLFCECLFL